MMNRVYTEGIFGEVWGQGTGASSSFTGQEYERSSPEVERLQHSEKKATPFSCKYDVAACKDG